MEDPVVEDQKLVICIHAGAVKMLRPQGAYQWTSSAGARGHKTLLPAGNTSDKHGWQSSPGQDSEARMTSV